MYFYREIQYTLNYIIQYQVWNLGEPFMLKCKRSEEAVELKGRSPATDSCPHHRDPRADFSEPSDTVYLLPKVPKCTYRYASEAKEILIARSPPLHCFYQCSQLHWVQLQGLPTISKVVVRHLNLVHSNQGYTRTFRSNGSLKMTRTSQSLHVISVCHFFFLSGVNHSV